MRISFDLDDTLVCHQTHVPQEPPLPWYLRWLVVAEPLRRGTVNLMCQLRSRGREVWIYTTSHRRQSAVRCWLRLHGVRIDGEEHGFEVVVIALDDREWVDRVLHAASELQRRSVGP